MDVERHSATAASAAAPGAPAAPPADAAPVSDESQRVQRDLRGLYGYAISALAIAFAAYYLQAGIRGPSSPQLHRGLFVGGTAVLVFLLYPAVKNGKSRRAIPFYDLILAATAAAAFGYFVVQFPDMASRSGAPSTLDTVMGLLAVALAVELTRRTTGWMLASIALVAIAYVFVGPYMPGLLRHGGFSVARFVSIAYPSAGSGGRCNGGGW